MNTIYIFIEILRKKGFMKINTLLVSIFIFLSLQVNASVHDSIQHIDTFENPEYIGYRIALVDMSSKLTKKGDKIKINFTAINTGRKDLLFGKNIAAPPNLVFAFDKSIYHDQLNEYQEEIRAAIKTSDFFVAAGKISKKLSIKVPKKSIPVLLEPTPVLATVEIEKQAVEKIEKSLVENTEATPVEKTEETFTTKEIKEEDIKRTLPSDKSMVDEDACSDLVFENVRIIKKSKNKVTLEYTIINTGKGPATLINHRKQEHKNMALQAYMSSKDQLTKSSFSFDGDFIQKGLNDSNGKLYPGKKYTGTIKLNINKMTKFTPYIILELDPYLAVFECDKRNNKQGIKVRDGIKD